MSAPAGRARRRGDTPAALLSVETVAVRRAYEAMGRAAEALDPSLLGEAIRELGRMGAAERGLAAADVERLRGRIATWLAERLAERASEDAARARRAALRRAEWLDPRDAVLEES